MIQLLHMIKLDIYSILKFYKSSVYIMNLNFLCQENHIFHLHKIDKNMCC